MDRNATVKHDRPNPDHELRSLLLTGLDYAYKHDDWGCPLDEALDGITAEQAAWRAAPDHKGIWDIVLHLTVWNDNIVERIETGKPARPAAGAWPARPESLSEAEWQAAKAALVASADRLRAYLETVPLEKIRASPYGFGDVVCRFNHLAYHIGQIVKMRECNGW